MIHHGIALAGGKKTAVQAVQSALMITAAKSCFTNSRKQHGEGHDRKYYKVVDDEVV